MPIGMKGIDMEEEPKNYTIQEYILFKLDRNIALIGLIMLGLWAMSLKTPESFQIGLAVVSGLVGYVGGRGSK